MSSVDLKQKIEAARAALDKALIAGDKTASLREYLKNLLAEQATANAAVADRAAAQQALNQIVAQRIADDAERLAECRQNRIEVLLGRFKPTTLA